MLSKFLIDSYFIYSAFSYQSHSLIVMFIKKTLGKLNAKNKYMWTHF